MCKYDLFKARFQLCAETLCGRIGGTGPCQFGNDKPRRYEVVVVSLVPDVLGFVVADSLCKPPSSAPHPPTTNIDAPSGYT